MNRASSLKENFLFAFVTISALGVAGIIYYLTIQNGPETLDTQAIVVSLFPAAFPQHYHNDLWIFLGLNSARRMAHIYEYSALSLFVTMMLLFAPNKKKKGNAIRSIRLSFLLSILLCGTCSFLDQVHKTTVIYRHFDPHDLLLDAIGYVLTAALVCLICRFKCRPKRVLSPVLPSSVTSVTSVTA